MIVGSPFLLIGLGLWYLSDLLGLDVFDSDDDDYHSVGPMKGFPKL